MSYTKYPLVIEGELLKYKVTPLSSVKRIYYSTIINIEYLPKKIKISHTLGRTTIYRHNFKPEDWETINTCIRKIK